MKITKIRTAESRSAEIKGSTVQDYCLYLFRSPVIFTIGGTDRIFSNGAAILYKDGISRCFRGTGIRGLKYDLVQFRPSSADKQYIADLEIPLNTPVEVYDDYSIAEAIKNLDMNCRTVCRRKTELCELYLRIILISLEEAVCGIELAEKDVPVENLSVDKLCRRLAVSRTYFHRIYMAAFGVTFRQDAIKSRLSYACRLLLETELSVGMIAEKCGYESESYFMRQFRQHMGCTPSEYRRKQL